VHLLLENTCRFAMGVSTLAMDIAALVWYDATIIREAVQRAGVPETGKCGEIRTNVLL
jgi:hypothetical protein